MKTGAWRCRRVVIGALIAWGGAHGVVRADLAKTWGAVAMPPNFGAVTSRLERLDDVVRLEEPLRSWSLYDTCIYEGGAAFADLVDGTHTVRARAMAAYRAMVRAAAFARGLGPTVMLVSDDLPEPFCAEVEAWVLPLQGAPRGIERGTATWRFLLVGSGEERRAAAFSWEAVLNDWVTARGRDRVFLEKGACVEVAPQVSFGRYATIQTGRLSYAVGSFSNSLPLRIYPRLARLPSALGVAVYDPERMTIPAIRAVADGITIVEDFDGLERFRILVFGDESLSRKLAAADVARIRAFVRAGGRVVIMQQRTSPPPGLLPIPLRLDPEGLSHHRAFIVAPRHPVLEGMDEMDCRDWIGDGVVSRRSYKKPSTGAFEILLETATSEGLTATPLLTIKDGAGVFILSQMELGAKTWHEPAATWLLHGILKYAESYTAAPPPRVLFVGAARGEVGRRLRAFFGEAVGQAETLQETALPGLNVLIVDGSEPALLTRLSPARNALISFLQKGGTLVWHRLTPAHAPFLSSLAGTAVKVERRPAPVAVKCRPHPLSDGVSAQDLYGGVASRHGAHGREVSVYMDAVAAAGGEELLSGGSLTRIPVGAGQIIVSQILWDVEERGWGGRDLRERRQRYFITLMGRLGIWPPTVGVPLPRAP